MNSLQSLSADRQVALLFVSLFGVLSLITVLTAASGLRERKSGLRHDASAPARFAQGLRTVWLGAVVFWGAWASEAERNSSEPEQRTKRCSI